jgi:hypothetical protein
MKHYFPIILTCLVSSGVLAETPAQCMNMRIRAAYHWGVAITYKPCLNGVAQAEATKNVPANNNVVIPVVKDSNITFKEYYPYGTHKYQVSGSMPALSNYGIDCGGATGWDLGDDEPACYLKYPYSHEWKGWQRLKCQKAASGEFQCN